MKTLSLFFLFAAGNVVGAAPAMAADIVVPDAVPTIGEAVEGLKDGDRILLLPGEYELSAKAPEGIGFSIIGRDGAAATTMRGSVELGTILECRAGHKPVRIEGITFDRTDVTNTYALRIEKAKLTIAECVFLGGAGVLVDSCEGEVRGNRFEGNFDALRLQASPMKVWKNDFIKASQYAITCRGSRAEIVNNQFREIGSGCVVVVGKLEFPVIGGSRGKGNVFIHNLFLLVANESRNEINARYNYWGPVVTSTMDRLGYPADLPEFQDYWDSEERAAGKVDYRNWLDSEKEIHQSMPYYWYSLPAILLILLLAARRKRKRRSAA